MSRKRTHMPDVYNTRKRICAATASPQPTGVWNNHASENKDDAANSISDSMAALLYVKGLFPEEKFEGRVPRIVMKHQLYSLVKNRTKADQEVGDMINSGEIRVFKLGTEANELAIVFTVDYKELARQVMTASGIPKPLIEKFIQQVVTNSHEISLSVDSLKVHSISDEDVTQLVKAGVLTVRDVGSWWMAIPAAGVFMKSFIRGRKAILTMIRKCKYREILQSELETRKLPKVAKLGMPYHILDIIGADLVECTPTTSGQLLRLKAS